MPNADVDQLLPDGSVIEAPDPRLTDRDKVDILKAALPGAQQSEVAGVRAVRFQDHVILYKQVTYLGHPWESFKKRIQIPKSWLGAYEDAMREGLDPRFVGIYRYGDVVVIVDFGPETYILRKANNSAAHVATNDLYQAVTLGIFSREDSRGNRLTSVRADRFAEYLAGAAKQEQPGIEVFRRFNEHMLTRGRLESLSAVREMDAVMWPDRYQGEWPGFYLEFSLDRFVRERDLDEWVAFQKSKRKGAFDYDLVLHERDRSTFFGDLKASNAERKEAPGNDAADLQRCIEEYGRFWYVVYEHDTWLSRNNGNRATVEWNEWKRARGVWPPKKEFDPLSYSTRFKEAVDFNGMFVLEVNPANIDVVLGDFHQGHQPGGAARAVKVMIRKRNIENFLLFSDRR